MQTEELIIKAIAFDLGDTLIHYKGAPLNWSSLYSSALLYMASGCRYSPTVEQINSAKSILERYNTRICPRTVEVSSDEIIAAILKSWGLPEDSFLDMATSRFFHFFQRELAAYDDTIPALEYLRKRGVSVGVLTDAPYGMKRDFVLQDLAEAGNLQSYIDVLLTSVDVGYRKPEPVGYLKIAAALSVRPEDMLYVGNEQKDIQGATAAGMPSILLLREGPEPDWGQCACFQSLSKMVTAVFESSVFT